MEVNPGYDGRFESAIRDGEVVEFRFNTDAITSSVTDVWPIRALPGLDELYCRGSGSGPNDGTYRGNAIDLARLRGMRLTMISIKDGPIKDLSPLIGLPLTKLVCRRTKVADLSPLRSMPLEVLHYDMRLFDEADEAILRSLPLVSITYNEKGDQPIDVFWQELAQRRNVAQAFAKDASQLSPANRLVAVLGKLDELNGADQVRLTHKLDGERLAQAEAYLGGKTADLTPLMALDSLNKLTLYGCLPWQDLSCLKFLPLEELTCSDDALYKNQNTLREIKTLRTINGMPADQFWSKLLGE